MGDENPIGGKIQSNKSINEDDEVQEDQGWQKVRQRNPLNGNIVSGKTNKNSTKLNLLERMSMSFYITNFPNHVTAKDLWKRCLKWGTVVDVFIPNRLSKAGRRFRFVRYIKVDNAARLLTDLKSMWFGNYLIFADVVKYTRNTGFRKTSFQQETPNQQSEYVKKDTMQPGQKKKQSMTYVDALSGVKGSVNEASNGFPFSGNIPLSSTSTRHVKLSCQDDITDRNSFSLLAKIKDPEYITKAAQWLFDEGFSDFNVSYIGGRWLLFMFGSSEAKDLFLANEFLKGRFCVFKTPCNFFAPDERMVWVELWGLPLGAWKMDYLQSILDKWGKCVFFANDWEIGFPLCKVCVLVQSSKFVFEELQVSLDDKHYAVWIKESAMWEPKFSKPSLDSSLSHESSEDDDSFNQNWSGDVEGTPSEQFDSQLCHSNSKEPKNEYQAELDNQFQEYSYGGVTSCVNVKDDGPIRESIVEGVVDSKFNLEIPTNEYPINNSVNQIIPESLLECDEVGKEANCSQDGVASFVGDKINSSERSVHHNSGLDDHEVFLLNRLLHQDKCRVRPIKAAASSDLKLAEESSSTWLDYVGPLLTDELDPEICWSYNDPSRNVQGSFSLVQLHTWKDYFSSDFEIWRYYGSVKETVLLHSALKRRTKDVG